MNLKNFDDQLLRRELIKKYSTRRIKCVSNSFGNKKMNNPYILSCCQLWDKLEKQIGELGIIIDFNTSATNYLDICFYTPCRGPK